MGHFEPFGKCKKTIGILSRLMNGKSPKIHEKLLTINPFSRPGRKLVGVRGVVVHWIGNPNGGAEQTVDYFESLSKQDPDKNPRYASAHYCVGHEGEIFQCIPDDEVAYHVGAREYVDGILEKFDTTWPNNCLLGVEMSHVDWSGKFNQETWKSSASLVAHLLLKYDLPISTVVRHYDVTGKLCPKYFVDHQEEYQMFLVSIQKAMDDFQNKRNFRRDTYRRIR